MLGPIVTPENYLDYLEFEEFKVFQGNRIKRTDSYSLSHHELKINTVGEGSHIYNRKRGMIKFGANKIIKDLTEGEFTAHQVNVAHAHAIRNGMPFPRKIWDYIVDHCGGKLPLIIQMLPDGRWCPKGTPFVQIREAIPGFSETEGFGEFVTWFEAVLLKCAFPSGCATRAFEMRKYLENATPDFALKLWRIHSFGFRGQNSDEDAFWGGMAFTTFLPGTDDWHISFYYPEVEMGSIRALAHKVTQQFNPMTAEEAKAAYGINKALPGDVNCMYHAIDVTALDPNPARRTLAVVIDTYDAMKVINHHVVDLARYAQLKGVHLVFRPDSGDVLEQAIMIYWKLFNAGLTGAAHCIIGEGITFEVVQEYDKRLIQEGIPLSHLFYGMGAGFYKDIERDSTGMAMKTCYSNNKDRMKLVLTAPEKSSIPGFVDLVMVYPPHLPMQGSDPSENNGLLTIVPEEVAIAEGMKSEYVRVYEYHHETKTATFIEQSWTEIRELALSQSAEQGRISMSPEILAKIEAQRAALIGG